MLYMEVFFEKRSKISQEVFNKKNRNCLRFFSVPTTGVEPARPYEHYPLKVACLPIPPRGPLEF